ncbi:MAG: TonB-dependent receptor [Proteobacteria bacterium]|nr:TonB-dependent receptor [Pseudomonadota bacterium]
MIYSRVAICAIFFLTPFKTMAIDVYEVSTTSLSSSENTGSSETIIKATEIEEYQEIFLKDALPYTPSVLVNSNGTVGRQTDFSIRGARSPQNLVLVDGIYVNDPASGGSVDLSNFLNADLERIEILPGPQNLAYGPGALGGVVQLIPKRGRGKPSLKAHAEGGSFRTKYGAITGQGEEGPLQFTVTAAGFGRGPSSFTNQLHGNRQSDRYRNGTLSSRINYALTDNWEVEGLVRYIEGKVQFDSPKFNSKKNSFLPFIAENFSDFQTLLTSLENKWGDEHVDHSLKFMYSRFQRHTTMPSFHSHSLGEHPLFLYRSDININSQNQLLAGLEGGQERATDGNLHKRTHGGIFLIHTYKPFESTALRGGIRGDHYQSLGSRITFNVGVDQQITETTTLRTSYGTNFKPPVLSDLFQKNLPWQAPNPSLKPEKSQSYEAGIDQTFFKEKLKASITGFITRIEQIVLSHRLSSGKWQRYNGGKRVAKGFEISFALTPIKTLQITTAFTLTRARDFPGDKKSPLIPNFKGAGGIQWKALSDLSLFIQGYGVTSMKDSASKRKLAPYAIIHLGGAYDLTKHIALFGRIENLTNKHYEEVFGYGTRGRAFFIGVEAQT